MQHMTVQEFKVFAEIIDRYDPPTRPVRSEEDMVNRNKEHAGLALAVLD